MLRHTAEVQAGLNLRQGPMMRSVLYRMPQGDRLFITIHHLVTDGVSWRILLEDLAAGYRQAKDKTEVCLPVKTGSFLDFSRQMYLASNTDILMEESDYWKDIENNTNIGLPRDKDAVESLEKNAGTEKWGLSQVKTKRLLAAGRRYGVDVPEILLTALARAMGEWKGIKKLPVMLEGHGRDEVIKGLDVSRTVGWFTAMFPFIVDISGSDDPLKQLDAIRNAMRNVPNRGIGYGILKYLSFSAKHASGDADRLPPLSFNYMGSLDTKATDSDFQPAVEKTGPGIDPDAPGILTLKSSLSYQMTGFMYH